VLNYYSTLSSEVYDIDKPIGHSFGDVEFYQERLSNIKGRVLEPATGTGRILIPLLENGIQVDGFDVSPEMLRICRENCSSRSLQPTLLEGRMESFSLETHYEAIIIPTGTFLLLHERKTSIEALKNFYNHLIPGGKLILDLSLQTEFETGKITTRTWECDNGDIITLEQHKVNVDFVNQFSISHNRYEKWRDGVLTQTELEPFPLRWYGVEEFRLILEKIGFVDIEMSSDYQHGAYPTSAVQVVTFEATKG